MIIVCRTSKGHVSHNLESRIPYIFRNIKKTHNRPYVAVTCVCVLTKMLIQKPYFRVP